MSAYKSVHRGAITFDGQQVEYQLKRLSVADAIAFKSLKEAEAEAFIRERLVHISTIEDADGTPVPLDTIFADFYFAPLVNALSDRLFETGHIPKEKADPSGGNSSAASPGEGSRKE